MSNPDRRPMPPSPRQQPRPAPAPQRLASAKAVIMAMVQTRTACLTPRANSRGLAQADMRRQLEARGIKPAA